jgi:DNA segregation ATPase FtsK/SpoIIIE, S-DNA-T family
MAKRKNQARGKENKNDGDEDEKKTSFIHGDAKRSIVAVFLFAMAVLFLLGFLDVAGALGNFLNKAIGLLFGWGKWVSPLVLVIGGIILLYRKETLFYVTKLFGLGVAFFSVLGFLHLYAEPDKLLALAKEGIGGGYAGYVMAFILLKLTGTIAGTVILTALFLIGVILAFNFSIISFLQHLPSLRKKEEEILADASTDDGGKLAEKENTDETNFVEDPEENRVWVEEEKKTDPNFSVKPIAPLSHELRIREGNKSSKKWTFPPLDLLEPSAGKAHAGDVSRNAKIIHDTLSHFGIEVELGEIQVGPTVTQYSFRPAVGVKLSKITGLSNDLALALAAHPIRIEAPIPGKSLVGVEVPNKQFALVRLRNILGSDQFKNRKSSLTLALGEDVSGSYIFSDLKKMPHLMIAGSTNTGKSVCINTILLTLLYQNSPENLRLILIDPKRVELTLYNDIPHLLSNTIVENGNALKAFKWAISEMERRYRVFQDTGSRDLESYNEKVRGGEKRNITDPETGEITEEEINHLPYIVIIIDEMADLMFSHGKEVEGAIIRLAQMARAVGIHLIISTQRPSVEVLTGLIKANISTRIAFKVATLIDSRTILDASGAEKLLGNGDMLMISSQSAKPKRVQGVLVSEMEVKKVVKFIRDQGIETDKHDLGGDTTTLNGGKVDFEAAAAANPQYEDDLYEEAKRVVIEAGKASSSLLQRRLRVGYARAARLIDMLEEQGIIGPGEGAKPREILQARESSSLGPEGTFASQNEPGDGNEMQSLQEDDSKNKLKDEEENQSERNKWQI